MFHRDNAIAKIHEIKCEDMAMKGYIDSLPDSHFRDNPEIRRSLERAY